MIVFDNRTGKIVAPSRCPSVFRPHARWAWKEREVFIVVGTHKVVFTRNPLHPMVQPIGMNLAKPIELGEVMRVRRDMGGRFKR